MCLESRISSTLYSSLLLMIMGLGRGSWGHSAMLSGMYLHTLLTEMTKCIPFSLGESFSLRAAQDMTLMTSKGPSHL